MDKIKIEELKENLDKVVYKEYVPIREQLSLINSISATLVAEDLYGMYRVNDVNLEISKVVAVVDLFTNVEIGDNDLDNYDYIMECGLYYKILDKLEYAVFDFEHLLSNAVNTRLNENSYNYILAKRTNEFVDIVDNTMKHLNDMLDKGDPNTIAKHLSKGLELLAKRMPDFSKLDVNNPLNKGR